MSYQSERNWDGYEIENDEYNLGHFRQPTHGHRNIKLEQDGTTYAAFGAHHPIGCPLEFSSKEGCNYFNDKGKVGKLRTARGKKTNQINLGPHHAKVQLASGEMTYDDSDLAMVLSSGS